MRRVLTVFALMWLAATACGLQPAASTASSLRTSPVASPLAPAGGGYDAEVAMPSSFPADVPIYPKARLTAAAQFASTGQLTWGMEWQIGGASIQPVVAFYTKEFPQRDWTLTQTASSETSWSATFARKSDSHVQGTLTINNDQNVIRILVSLVYPA